LRLVAVACVLGATALPFIAATATARAASLEPHAITGTDAVAFQMNAAHTGASTDAVGPQWTQAWTTTLGGAVGYPLVVAGRVYVLDNAPSPSLIAYDGATGAIDWQDAVGASLTGITYNGGRIFEQSGSIMTAYDATTGAQDWSATMSGQYEFNAAPTASNGIVYSVGAGSGGTLYALSESTGATLWTQEVENGNTSSPAVGDGNVYTSFACDLTQVFNATTGSPVWQEEYGCEGGGGQTSVLADGDLFLRDTILNAATGATVRSLSTDPPPAVDGQNAYTEKGGTLEAQTVANGSVLWSFAGDGDLITAPIVVNGVVYEGSSTGNLYGVSATTGQLLWSDDIGTAMSGNSGFTDSYNGLGEGDGLLVVPAGDTLTVFDNSGSTPAAPAAPTATFGNASATVDWTVPADNGSAITDYTVTPSIDGVAQTPTVIPAGATGTATSPTAGASDALSVTGLTNGSTYTFTVAADSANGTGAASPASNAVTPLTDPAAPISVAAQSGETASEVSWTVATNGGDPITNFIITPYVGLTAGAPVQVAAGAVGSQLDPSDGAIDSYNVTGLTAGSATTFTVAAKSAFGTGAPSQPSNAVTPTAGPTVPYMPGAVSATTTGGQVTVYWTTPGNNGSTITGFVITPTTGNAAQAPVDVPSGASGSATSPVAGAVDDAVLGGLTLGSSYTFTVQAINAIGTSAASAATNAVTPNSASFINRETSLDFSSATLGTYTQETEYLDNTGTTTGSITDFAFGGADPDDFVIDTNNCQSVGSQDGCTILIDFFPGAIGPRSATITPIDNGVLQSPISLTGTGTEGYYEATAAGIVTAFGDGSNQGDLTGKPPSAPVVTIQSTGDGGGYWMAASNGYVWAFGDAFSYGGAGNLHLNSPIVGMAITPDDGGYWLVAADGGIFSYGDAAFYGSTGALKLNKPIVGMAVTPDGGGYWLVASDGGIFAFGDAPFYGSTGDIKLNKPVVGMAPTPDGGGYDLVASDGGIFSYGDAAFYGSTGAIKLNKPIVAMSMTPDGGGYWLAASDGGIFSYGDAAFYGSTGGGKVTNNVGIALTGGPTLQASLDVPADRHLTKSELVAFRVDRDR
jgi:outer membrane protein assembly factor BamB